MIALVKYNGHDYIGEKQIEMTSDTRNHIQVEWRLHTGEYVFAYNVKVGTVLDTDDLGEACRLYPELLI